MPRVVTPIRFHSLLIELALIVIVAMLGRWMAGRTGQPAVLGELLIGVAIGNIGYALGRPLFVLIMHMGDASALFRQVWASGASVADAGGSSSFRNLNLLQAVLAINCSQS